MTHQETNLMWRALKSIPSPHEKKVRTTWPISEERCIFPNHTESYRGTRAWFQTCAENGLFKSLLACFTAITRYSIHSTAMDFLPCPAHGLAHRSARFATSDGGTKKVRPCLYANPPCRPYTPKEAQLVMVTAQQLCTPKNGRDVKTRQSCRGARVS